jgi:hypothetical protein
VKNNVIAVDLCPNDCLAFWDAKHPKLAHHMHKHRTHCPVCAASRKIIGKKGQKKAAKVGFYFPMDDWMFSNFKDSDLHRHRETDLGKFPPGHTRKSKGWHEKITANPHMNAEPRNQAIIGMADGLPIFKDKNSRGVNIVALRQGNQPDSISKKYDKMHLSTLYPCDYWMLDAASGLMKRESHHPANIGAMLVLLADDLLFWYDGKMAEDFSLKPTDPARKFLLRVVLLFWCGDYPGLGEATNFIHKGYNHCHWCKDKGEHSKLLHRMVISRYRRCAQTTTSVKHQKTPIIQQLYTNYTTI